MRTETRPEAREHVASRPLHRARPIGAAGVWPDGPERTDPVRLQRLTLGALAAGLLALLGPIAVSTLVDCWHDENYSHGVLVPILVLILMHRRHHDIFRQTARVAHRLHLLGWAMFASGCLAFVVGAAAAESFTLRASGVLILVGLCGILGGPLRLRRYGPPVALLLCAVPLPYVLFYKVSFPLQLFSAHLAASGLQLLALDVARNGNILEVGGHALEVVGACSGIRSMMALCTLALTAAVALRLGLWRGAVLAVAALPAAMLGNLLRLVATALLVLHFGSRGAEGTLHEVMGLASFAASLGLLAVCVRLLRRGHGAAPARTAGSSARPGLAKLWAWMRELRLASPRATWIAIALLVAAGGYGGFLRAHAAEPGATPRLAALPYEFDGLVGEDVPLDDRVLDKLNPESYVFRTYRAGDAPGVGLYVAYYRDPREGAQIHSPMHCYPGAGWRILSSEPLPVRDLHGQSTRMQRLVVEKHGARDVVVYWYDTRTGRLTSDFDLKWNLMRTALLHRPQDAAFVRWSTTLDEGEDVGQATARPLSAVARAYPHIEGALPFGG